METKYDIFWDLLKAEHERARAYCHRLTEDPDNGDDLYHDIVLRALKGFAGLKDHAAFRFWFYRIINNSFKTWLKSHKKSPWLSFSKEMEESLPGENPAALQPVYRRLQVAMAALSPRERVLITLFELEGWSHEELSKVTGKSAGSLRTKLSRIRAKMRRTLSRSCRHSISPVRRERRICDVLPYDS